MLYFNKLHKYSDYRPFLPLFFEGHRLCADPTVQGLWTCLGLSWFSLVLTPALEPADCCLSCFSFSSGNSTYGEGVTHCVTNNSLLCPCGLGQLVTSTKEVNHYKETYKNSSKHGWDWRWENPHSKHHTSPGKDFQMLAICSNTASSF